MAAGRVVDIGRVILEVVGFVGSFGGRTLDFLKFVPDIAPVGCEFFDIDGRLSVDVWCLVSPFLVRQFGREDFLEELTDEVADFSLADLLASFCSSFAWNPG